MEREELLDGMREASSPNENSTAITDARAWLAEHPDDDQVASALADVIQAERRSFDTP